MEIDGRERKQRNKNTFLAARDMYELSVESLLIIETL